MNPMLRNSKTRMLIKQVFLILFCLDLALSLSLGSLSRILQQEKQQDTMESSWPLQKIETEDGDVLKKRCEGFPCMYNHIASKAGHAELGRTLSSFISHCLGNPSCDPAKDRLYMAARINDRVRIWENPRKNHRPTRSRCQAFSRTNIAPSGRGIAK